jgi:hypothetical protein
MPGQTTIGRAHDGRFQTIANIREAVSLVNEVNGVEQ